MSEHGHQSVVIAWCDLCKYKDARKIFAIPNGTNIPSHTGRAKAKREGLKAGVPDLMLPVARGGFNGLFIEMKKPKDRKSSAGKPSKEQLIRLQELSNDGYFALICIGADVAIDTIIKYLSLDEK